MRHKFLCIVVYGLSLMLCYGQDILDVELINYGSKVELHLNDESNTNLNSEVITIFTKSAIQTCVEECKVRKLCSYINFHFRTNACFLIRSKGENETISVETSPGYAFGNKSTWDLTKFENCNNCTDAETCHVDTGLCTVEECRLTHDGKPASYLVGNVYTVGKKIAYWCDLYHSMVVHSTRSATCLPNGTWTEANFTCVELDECESNPCQNGGLCNDMLGSYMCSCANGWTGINCEIEINECDSIPCQNGGQCNDEVNGYSCSCASGYAGNNCETDIDECDSYPCQNGGQCNDLVNEYTCSCASGYTGNDCQIELNECDSSPCQNGGSCNDMVNGYTCSCASGYAGNDCQTDENECNSTPCQNGATCTDIVNGYTCSCLSGWYGPNCEIEINECESSPCLNGGTCNNMVNKYTCTCASGYTGNDCETVINECNSSPCQNGATCNNMLNGYTCSCVSGWGGNDCETEINECTSSPCVNGGTCHDIINGYTCTCASGYTGNDCETELQCAQGWSKYQLSCYRLEATKANYSNAKGICVNLGGHLADVTSQDEMDFLEDLYRQSHSTSEVDGVWVSTTDIKVENEWVLSDGSAASYLNWHPGQPDKEFDYDDCVQVWPNLGFQWNDVYCIYSYWFYCEYEL